VWYQGKKPVVRCLIKAKLFKIREIIVPDVFIDFVVALALITKPIGLYYNQVLDAKAGRGLI